MLTAMAALALGLSLTHSGAFAAEPSKNAYPGAFDRPPANEQPALTTSEQKQYLSQFALD